MEITSLIILALLIAGAIISLVFGIKLLIKYNQTRKKLHLFLGILLTFVVPAILLYFVFRSYLSTTMVYGPDPMIDYGPGPA